MAKELGVQLLNEVKHLVNEHDLHALTRIKELLELGADPKKEVLGENSYEFILKHNKDGRFNAVVEEFDSLKSVSLREKDSIDEGMHLREGEED
jgi:hypothetical protein